MVRVNRLWEAAAQLLESASAIEENERTELAILIDEQSGLRMVDASGWQLHALRREYKATTAYSIKRDSKGVVVEADNGSGHCTLAKKASGKTFLQSMGGVPAFHLIYPTQAA